MIIPVGMTAVEWTDRMTLLLEALGASSPDIDSDDEWKLWAREVVQDPNIAVYNPPSPEEFQDWREWAERFNQTVPVD